MDDEPARLEILLVRTARNVRRAFDTRLRAADLNMTEAGLLSFVRDQGALTQRELADRLHIGRASVGTFIDGLEKRDLVQRSLDPADRRVWQISLTEAGTKLVNLFDQIDAELRSDLRAGLARKERHLLADLLLRVEQNANAVVAGEVLDPAT
jgi:MarR family transcriptional regulator for hemolysin